MRQEILRVSLSTVLASGEDASGHCPVCGDAIGPDTERILRESGLFDIGPLLRFRCACCDAVYGPLAMLRMSPKRLSAEYRLLYSFYSEPETTAFQSATFEALRVSGAVRVLNFACGNWRRGITHLLAKGFDVYGYEPSLPKQHPRIATDLSELAGLGFDGIFSHNFVEHVQDPVAQFEQWKMLLSNKGRMAHSTACFDYAYDESPFHICYLLGRSLDHLCERTGLRVVARTHLDTDKKASAMTIALIEHR